MRELRAGLHWSLGEALRFGVEATRTGSASMPADHGVRLSAAAWWWRAGRLRRPAAAAGRDVRPGDLFVERVGDDALAAHDRIVAVRAHGPGSA